MFIEIYLSILLFFTYISSNQSTNDTLNKTTSSTIILTSKVSSNTISLGVLLSSTTTPYVSKTPKNEINNVGLGIGIGVGGFFVLLSIVLIVLYCVLKPGDKEDQDNVEMKISSLVEKNSVKEYPPREPHEVPVSEFISLLQYRRKNKHQFQEEFKSLPPPKGPRLKSCSEALMHPSKNRYTDILPYNVDRVKLKALNEDYINASFIDGYEREKEFIATQGPLRETCDQFWCMVWEQKSEKIIMLTNLLEDGMPKCAQYFPCKQLEGLASKVMTFKHILVHLVDEEAYEEYIFRKFSIQKGNEKRQVVQYHYTSWPDKGVPSTCTSLLKFRNVCLADLNDNCNPVVIHCSAGVGRTGTLVAIDMLLKQACKRGVVDVAMVVDKMRRQRVSMVQTLSQYIFTYHAVAEGLFLGNVSMKPKEFLNFYLNLEKPHLTGKSYLELQFELLTSSMPYFSEHSFTNGRNHREYNRFSQILPMDDFMPSFSTNDEDYINAVQLIGFKGNRDIIVTQSPMPKSFETFWKMVKEHKCYVVVMLNDLLENEPKYWPDDGQAEAYGEMAVLNEGEISSDDIVASNLRVANLKFAEEDSKNIRSRGELNEGYNSDQSDDYFKQKLVKDPDSFHVRHFRLNGWDEKHYPKDKISSLLLLTSEVRRCLERIPEGCLLVHCLNGADKSGLFSTLLNVMWKLEKVSEVDVHNAVKMVLKIRNECLASKEQLKYIYDIIHHDLLSAKLNDL